MEVSVNDIRLQGSHNLENVLCAVLVAKLNKIKNEDIILGVSNFLGLNHRLEFVETINGISFYNDSKSTTIKATQTALKAFNENKVLLILGGSFKGFNYDELFVNLSQNVKHIICLGEVKDNILLCAKNAGFNKITSVESFNLAVKLAFTFAKKEKLDTVLLSPATASFDMFKNFEERGNTFKKLVKELKGEV